MRCLVLGFMGSAVLFAVACGGNVVVDGGGGGDILSTGSVSSAGGTGQVSTVSSGTGGAGLCEQACSALKTKGCGDTTCVPDCQQAYATAFACAPLLDALALCYINSPSLDCNNPVECQDAAQKYAACVDPGSCGNPDCSVSSDGSCSCNGPCNGSTLKVQCSPGDLTDFCTCFKDGTPVGKCNEPKSSGATCDFLIGCCGPLFFP